MAVSTRVDQQGAIPITVPLRLQQPIVAKNDNAKNDNQTGLAKHLGKEYC